MYVFQRKNGNTGEIHVIVTEKDRGNLLVNGLQWVDLNETMNDFNKDDDINDVKITASYAGDISDETITKTLTQYQKTPNNNQTPAKEDKKAEDDTNPKRQKVDTSGRIIKTDEDGDEIESDMNLGEYLENEELKCPECNEIGKALINKKGEILPCESCIKIDAFLEGKKKGFSEGYEKGYNDCMTTIQKLLNLKDDNEPEITIEELLNKGKQKNGK